MTKCFNLAVLTILYPARIGTLNLELYSYLKKNPPSHSQPPSQMHLQTRRSARLVARKIRQPGSSYLKMIHDATAP